MISNSNYLIIYVILVISASRPFSCDAEIEAMNHFKIIIQNFTNTVCISCELYIRVSSIVIYYNSLTSQPVLVSTNSSAVICLCWLNRKQSDPYFSSLKPKMTYVGTNMRTVTLVHTQFVVYWWSHCTDLEACIDHTCTYLSINPIAYPDGCRISAHFYGSKITPKEGRKKL